MVPPALGSTTSPWWTCLYCSSAAWRGLLGCLLSYKRTSAQCQPWPQRTYTAGTEVPFPEAPPAWGPTIHGLGAPLAQLTLTWEGARPGVRLEDPRL